MKIIVKQTNELSPKDVEQYNNCYTQVYERPTTVEGFIRHYSSTVLGYSIHAFLCNEEDIIVGAYSLIPFLYDVQGEKKMFAYAAGLMIEKEYRGDFSNLFGLVKTMLKTAKKHFSCVYIFPNDNANIVNKQLIKATRIGNLDTYLLPYKIGKYKPNLRWLNLITAGFSECALAFSRLTRANNVISLPISKSRSELETTRMKWSAYQTYNDGQMTATWKVTKFEGIEAAFLIDFHPFSKKVFDKAVRTMVKKEKRNVGLFIYVGLLPFTPLSMIKVPKKFSPKEFRFDIKVFDDNIASEVIENAYNWDINLSSYDLI